MNEPVDFMAGDTVTWEKALSDYSPADGWVLSYALAGPSIVDGTKVTVTPGTVDWTVTLPGTLTAPLLPGTYRWTAFATLAGVRNVVDEGVFSVRPDAAKIASAVVSHAAKMLAALEAEILARVSPTASNPVGSAHDSYSINGRSIAKMKMGELEQLRDRYTTEVWRERNPSSASPSRVVRFGYAV